MADRIIIPQPQVQDWGQCHNPIAKQKQNNYGNCSFFHSLTDNITSSELLHSDGENKISSRGTRRSKEVPFRVLFDGGPSLFHGGSPCPEKSLNFRYDIVSRIILALSSCEVMAAGSGSIFANS